MSEHSSLGRALLLSKHTLKRARGVILATAGLLALFQTVMIAVAGSIQQSGSFEQLGALLPPFVRQLLGPTIASFLSWRNSQHSANARQSGKATSSSTTARAVTSNSGRRPA